MSTLQRATEKSARNALLDALTADRRRLVLLILADRSAPASELDLAVRVAAAETEKLLVDVTQEEVESVRSTLAHVHLPKLADAGLVTRDETAATVTASDHPVLTDSGFRQLVETEADDWSDVLSCLADERRRAVLAVLRARDGPMAMDELARDVAVREPDEGSPEATDEVLASLYHHHLPQLADAGLVEYDADDGTVAYRGRPELEESWFDDRDEEPRAG